MTSQEFQNEVIERLTRLEERFLAHIEEERKTERRWAWLAGMVVTIALTAWTILAAHK